MSVATGLERLIQDKGARDKLKGQIGLLCHTASVTSTFQLAPLVFAQLFGQRFVKIFGPQHGFSTDVQDNMVETKDFFHPYFKRPVYSLYSHTRIPTDEMLKGLDCLVVDLQDVGTRVYTYIHTLSLLMQACGKNDVQVVVLDRPNPVGGEIIEGNCLRTGFESFVGLHPVPMRHSLTMGEMARLIQRHFGVSCDLEIIEMKCWSRHQMFAETGLPWILPSPNLPTADSALTFVGTVIFEGTNISEGRGTTRSLEIIGHPQIEPFSLLEVIEKEIPQSVRAGLILRPTTFMPTFQKHAGKTCGGYQLHPVDHRLCRPWSVAQHLCRVFKHHLKENFAWNEKPYEYQFEGKAIDYINGDDSVGAWVERNGTADELAELEQNGRSQFLSQREDCLIYR